LSVQTIARRYAAALADVVVAQKEEREVRQELSQWGAMMRENAQLTEIFRNPTIPYEQKQNVLQTLIARAKVRPTTANFLQVLLRNHRLADLLQINEHFARELDNRAGVVTAQITTARTMTSDAQNELRAQLENLTKRGVKLEFAVDEGLIGGVVTRIGSTVYDGSVRNQLELMKEKFAGAE
jgi:F-type H+-transporting ATPase subunit delta